MTHIVFSPAARPAKVLLIGRLVAATRTLWNNFQKERRLSATMRTLHRLNDHSLRDIGLERDNIGPVVRSRYLGR
jgi:uncharacterized protein YjiS (DUF1127 family)